MATVRASHQFVSIGVISTRQQGAGHSRWFAGITTSHHEGIEDSQVSTVLSFSSQLLVSARFHFHFIFNLNDPLPRIYADLVCQPYPSAWTASCLKQTFLEPDSLDIVTLADVSTAKTYNALQHSRQHKRFPCPVSYVDSTN